MTTKRSYRHLLLGSLGVALLLSNCTVKNDEDDRCEKGDKAVGCECPGNNTGYQQCGSTGVFGSCICPDGASGGGSSGTGAGGGVSAGEAGASTGGTTVGSGGANEGGANEGGANEGGAGAGGVSGEGGEGGEAPFAFVDCDECVETLCADEWEACFAADDEGLCLEQYYQVTQCIEEDRAMNNVSRDRLRGCGVTLGASADPNLVGAWAPEQMTDGTTNLINCLASSSSEVPNGDWADVNGPNFPATGGPKPWPADSCAKLVCTSKTAD